MAQLNISLPPPKDSPDFDSWLMQTTQYIRDYLGLYDSGTQVSFIQSGTGAVSRTSENKMRDILSVKDFGAVGDGTTNDASAFQAAIDAAIAAGGGRVFIPSGTYKLNSGLTCAGDDVVVQGDGEGATTLTTAFATGDIFSVNGYGNVMICDLAITSSVVRSSGAAVHFSNGHNLKAQNIRLDSNMYIGFQFDGGAGQFLYYLENFEINSGLRGIYAGTDGELLQDLWISDGVIANCTNEGILLVNVSGFYFNNIDILSCDSGFVTYPGSGKVVKAGFLSHIIVDSSGSTGWKLFENTGSVVDILINGCWGATCGDSDNGHGMHISQGSGKVSGIAITGSRFINNEAHGILLQDCTDVSIINCQCLCNSTDGSGTYHGIAVTANTDEFTIIGGTCGLGGQFSTNNQGYGIFINSGNSDNYVISGVNLLGNVTGGISDSGSGTTKNVTGNIGYTTESRGTGTIASGNTSVVVNHGLSVTPDASDIWITFTESPTDDPGNIWVSSISSTQFTVNCRSDPGASNLDFSWGIAVR